MGLRQGTNKTVKHKKEPWSNIYYADTNTHKKFHGEVFSKFSKSFTELFILKFLEKWSHDGDLIKISLT